MFPVFQVWTLQGWEGPTSIWWLIITKSLIKMPARTFTTTDSMQNAWSDALWAPKHLLSHLTTKVGWKSSGYKEISTHPSQWRITFITSSPEVNPKSLWSLTFLHLPHNPNPLYSSASHSQKAYGGDINADDYQVPRSPAVCLFAHRNTHCVPGNN